MTARDDEVQALRGEISALRERIGRIEALLLGLYGPGALGGAAPAPPPPADPQRPPTRLLATMFSRR